jgi:hypothetical protein
VSGESADTTPPLTPHHSPTADDLRRFVAGEPILARPPGWMARIDAWSRRPDRIGEAGALAGLSALIQNTVSLVVIFGILTGTLEFPNAQEMLRDTFQTAVPFGVLIIVVAWKTLTRRGWAIWAGAIASPLLAGWALASTMGWIPLGGIYPRGDPMLRLIIQVVTLYLYLMLGVLYLAALRAYTWDRRR